MHKEALHHENKGLYAYPVSTGSLYLRLRAARLDLVSCEVYYTERYDYTENLCSAKMELQGSDELFDYYETVLYLESKRFKYFFKLTDTLGQIFYYTNEKISRECPVNTLTGGFFQYAYINGDELPDTPEWVRDAVFYQIYPDRFFNGDCENDPPEIKPWDSPPQRNDFYGGDIRGIIEKLEYIGDLGANAIYLTPIFLSDSNHKYDTIDYYTIDPAFGSIQDMKELVELAHARGIRIILDAVFNHCSDKNLLFQDVVEKGKASPYALWFFIDSHPVQKYPRANYETFGTNIAAMPRLNTSHPDVREYLIGVAEYWTRELNIDGWRLDVADEVSHSFWKEFRRRLRNIRRDLFIIGEVWYNASPWLIGDEFDSVMNYPLRRAIIDFITDKDFGPSDLEQRLTKLFFSYRKYSPSSFLNLLGSHDTARITTLCGADTAKTLLAMAFMMAFPGIPMIYYGDELGIEGGEDPDCRRAMPWTMTKQSRKLHACVKKLISLRKSLLVLKYGEWSALGNLSTDKLFAFRRFYKGQPATFVMNAGDKPAQFRLTEKETGGYTLVDLWSEGQFVCDHYGNIDIVLEECRFMILMRLKDFC